MSAVRSGTASVAQWPPMHDSIYESWDLNPKNALPKRSYLYHLRPIGVGSAYVESLTGYIARLAEAHSVATGALLALELRPRVPSDLCVAAREQSAFSRATGVSPTALTHWVNMNTTFRLRPFLRMCSELRISPARILTERIPAGDLEWAGACELFARRSSSIFSSRPASQVRRALEEALRSAIPISLRQVAQELGYRSVRSLRLRNQDLCAEIVKKHGESAAVVPRRGKGYIYPTPEMAREALERAIRDSPHLSLNAMCKEIGYRNDTSLYHRFSDLCRVLITKHRQWRVQKDQRARDVISKALYEEPAPTLKEVAARLGYRSSALRSRFRDLCATLAARQPERQRFERERLRKQMEAALEQHPAPPMKVVAQFLGRDQAHLRIIFPDLYGRINRRYMEHQKTVRSQRRVQFLAQVRKAVIDLCECGINPSRKHVISVIENPSMQWTNILDRYIAQTLRQLETDSRIRSGK